MEDTPTSPNIEIIDLDFMVLIFDDGGSLDIVYALDAFGDEALEVEDVRSILAGSQEDGYYEFTITPVLLH